MAKDKVSVPISQAGITRYFEDYKSKIEVSPKIVIFFIVLIILLELILQSMA